MIALSTTMKELMRFSKNCDKDRHRLSREKTRNSRATIIDAEFIRVAIFSRIYRCQLISKICHFGQHVKPSKSMIYFYDYLHTTPWLDSSRLNATRLVNNLRFWRWKNVNTTRGDEKLKFMCIRHLLHIKKSKSGKTTVKQFYGFTRRDSILFSCFSADTSYKVASRAE